MKNATATVILDILGYKIYERKGKYPPQRRWMGAEIKAKWREVGQLLELEKGKTTKVLKRYGKLSVTKKLDLPWT